jgi:hypothetical protein
MPTVDEALVLGCSLARDYRGKNMSPMALLAASGYRKHRDTIDVAKIRKYVEQHPELVGDWMAYSDNKRTSTGCCFYAESSSGPYVLSYFPSRNPSKTDQKYSNESEACAVYIKYELESIAS